MKFMAFRRATIEGGTMVVSSSFRQSAAFRSRLGVARAYVASALPRPGDLQRLLIMTSGRTGSELLVSLLASHPHISCDAELLGVYRRWPDRFLAGREVRAHQRGALAYGIKVQPHHLDDVQDMEDSGAWLRGLHELGWAFICLRRRNTFHQAISVVRAHHEAQWHFKTGQADNARPLAIDPLVLMQVMYAIVQIEQRIDELLKDIDYVELFYEDHFETPERQASTLELITSRLGLPSIPTSTDLVRTSPVDVRETVINYSELVAELRRNRFSEYAEE
jgi:hypothetical protein